MSLTVVSKFALVAGLAGFVLVTPLKADPIDLSGRNVPALVPSSARLSHEKEYHFSATIVPDHKNKVYGLLAPVAPGAKVTINGRALDIDPLPRKDGLLYRIGERYLNEGANEFSITRSAEDSGVDWSGTALFSLENSTEEIHFNQMFTDAPSRVAPPAHASQDKYDVIWYDLSFNVSMASAVLLPGTTMWMEGESLDSSLQTVALDFHNNDGLMSITQVDGGPDTATIPYVYDSSDRRILVNFPSTIPAGERFRIRVQYDGVPVTGGTFGSAYVRSTHNGTAVVYTFSEPYKARNWWPCKDLPADKATTTTQRITVPFGQGWEVVAPGLLTSRTNNGVDETWIWSNSYPISTYLISLCVSNYVYVSTTYTSRDGLTNMPISHAIYPENSSGNEEGNGAAGTLEVMNFMADRFGEYPFLTEKYFTATHNSGSGMEHQTCTSMPPGDVFDGMQRRNVHELAHHWYGDKITCETFDHLWLNEGFATYAEALWDEFKFGTAAFYTRINGWNASRTQPVVGPNSDNFASSVAYQKGALVLHMLRMIVGDDVFWDIMKTWANTAPHAYGTAVSADFEAVAEAVSGRDLTTFFNQWLYLTQRPYYLYKGSTAKVGGDTQITITMNQLQGGQAFEMPVDLEIVDEFGQASTNRVENTAAFQTFPLTGDPQSAPCELYMDPDEWILQDRGLSINTIGLPRAQIGVPYQYRLQAKYADNTVSWSGAGLPPGLSLNSAGLITGTPTQTGNFSVSVTANDGLFNQSTTLNLDVQSTALPVEVIVESRNTAGTAAASGNGYSEAGTFVSVSSKSGAPKTVGNGSRYTATIGASAAFRPGIPSAGPYDVYITLDDNDQSTRYRANVQWTITHNGAPITGTLALNSYTPGLRNKWLLLASNVEFQAGTAGTVGGITFTNLDADGNGGAAGDRMNMDAVRFVKPASFTQATDWALYE